jgi:hypothetical protein
VPVKPIDMQQFIDTAGNIYEAIVVTSKRARQIHDEVKIELAQRLETVKSLTTTPDVEDENDNMAANPDQLKISLEFENRPKATDLALDDVRAGRIDKRYKEPVEEPIKEEPAE